MALDFVLATLFLAMLRYPSDQDEVSRFSAHRVSHVSGSEQLYGFVREGKNGKTEAILSVHDVVSSIRYGGRPSNLLKARFGAGMENIDIGVLVVGAGPTGLTLACDLARRGVSFR